MTKQTRIKICGLTRPEDVAAAIAEGADALGFVLYEKSPRYVSLDCLSALTRRLPPFVTPVLLFVNAEPEQVQNALRILPQALLQFHGDESSFFCEQFGRAYIKAVRMQAQTDLQAIATEYSAASALLLDSWSQGYGGSGHAFDWSWVPALPSMPLVLSGGLTPSNVADGIRAVGPWAVDVSSGVEHSKGVKDAQKIKDFCVAVRAA
jgi:phosphoribosylanthranilate isomerase